MLKLRAQLTKQEDKRPPQRTSEQNTKLSRRKNRNGCKFHWRLPKMSTLCYKALFLKQKGHEKPKSSYQGLGSILFLHLLSQLFEAGLQAVVERPQRLRDLLSVDANAFGEVRDLVGSKH